MTLPYVFEWPVDQAGYDLIFDEDDHHWIIRARGGPPRYYRPIEVEGLWRRFADQCLSVHGRDDRDGILAFVSEFGLLARKTPRPMILPPPVRGRPEAEDNEPVPLIGTTAALIRKIVEHYDKSNRAAAAELFNIYGWPDLTAGISGPNPAGRFEIALVPYDLRAALLQQTAETITGSYEWRRCRNEGCPVWFRIGLGGKTKRREFCSTRCRVAEAARRQKSSNLATEEKRS